MMDPHGQTMIVTSNPWAATIERYSSRKFLLTVFIQGIGAYAFLHHFMDGGTYVALSSIVLSSYGAASVADKHFNPGSSG